jgi:hypothetical protein
MPSDLGYAVSRAQGGTRNLTAAEQAKARENLLALGKGAVTAPFTLAPDAIGGLQGLLRWTESGEPIFDEPISGDPIRELVGLDPENLYGMAGEFLDPTSGSAKILGAVTAIPAFIKGAKFLKAKRVGDNLQVLGSNAVIRPTQRIHSKNAWDVWKPVPVERKVVKIIQPGSKQKIDILKNPDISTLRRYISDIDGTSSIERARKQMNRVLPEGNLGISLPGDPYAGFRYFEDMDGNWYFWDASDAIHWTVWKQLHPKKGLEFQSDQVMNITGRFSEDIITATDLKAMQIHGYDPKLLKGYDPNDIKPFERVGKGYYNPQDAIDDLEANPKFFGDKGIAPVDDNLLTRIEHSDELFSDAAWNRARGEARGNSRHVMVEMTPNEFLKMAKRAPRDADKMQALETAVEQGDQMDMLPHLWADVNHSAGDQLTMRVTGHEGRNRARLLVEAGRGDDPMTVMLTAGEHGNAPTIRWNNETRRPMGIIGEDKELPDAMRFPEIVKK